GRGKPAPAADGEPARVDGPVEARVRAGPAPGAVVLQPAIGPVLPARIDGDVIELTDRRRIEAVPVVHAVVGDVEPAVVAEEHVPALLRAAPQGMMIAMFPAAGVGLERLAGVA